jgi:hypothetical protein
VTVLARGDPASHGDGQDPGRSAADTQDPGGPRADSADDAEPARWRRRLPKFRIPAARPPVGWPALLPKMPRLGLRQPSRPRPAGPHESKARGSARSRRARAAEPHRTIWLGALAPSVTWLVAGVVLFGCYLHISRTVPVNSDGAANVLQAWAMLHGNPLLRGWLLSDVSFYTTELPQYMLIELVRGMNLEVVHIAGAMTYTLLVLLSAWLAKGRAKGGEGVLRAMLAAGIMIAPAQSSASLLLLNPDHVGSAVPVVLVFLLIDRAGRRWFVPVAVWLLLAWALIADQVVLITGVAPVAFVGLARGYQRVVVERQRARTAWYEVGTAVAALAAVETARITLAEIASHGGFYVYPVRNALAPFGQLPHNLQQMLQGTLTLFGADFPGQSVGPTAAVALLHLVGIGLVAWAVGAAVRRFGGAEPVVQLLAAAVVFSLVAYLLGANAAVASSSREFAAVLPLGAALAGRVLAARLWRARLAPALSVVLAGYVVGMVMAVTTPVVPAVPAQTRALVGLLEAHGLDYGLADYGLANVLTVDSGGKVAVRAIRSGVLVYAHEWEAESSWYSASEHMANFVIMPKYGSKDTTMAPTAVRMIRAYGQPADVYLLANYTVLVWDSNLLAPPVLHL